MCANWRGVTSNALYAWVAAAEPRRFIYIARWNKIRENWSRIASSCPSLRVHPRSLSLFLSLSPFPLPCPAGLLSRGAGRAHSFAVARGRPSNLRELWSCRCACPRLPAHRPPPIRRRRRRRWGRGTPFFRFQSSEIARGCYRRPALYKGLFISHPTFGRELWWHDLLFRKFKRFV